MIINYQLVSIVRDRLALILKLLKLINDRFGKINK